MRHFFISFLAGVCAIIGADAKDLRGSVKDGDGKGIAGVVVSDGLNTVLTDAKGRFRMTADEDSRFIFISTPSGYISSTLGGDNLFYKEIDDDVKKYDFTVRKNPADDTNHNVIVIADPQISDRDELPELGGVAVGGVEQVDLAGGQVLFAALQRGIRAGHAP